MSVLKIKNGATWESIPAIKGEDGHTPVKGTDYWTAEDKAEIVDDVMDEVEPEIDSIRIYDTASGEIASFPDGADGYPVVDLTVEIEPVQDLHGYDSPYPPGGGVNKLLLSDIDKSNTVQYVTATWAADSEELTLNGANSGSYAIVIDFRQENGHIKFPDLQVGDTWSLAANLPTGSYIGVVYKNTSNTDVQFWYLSGDGTFKKDTRTVPNDFVSFQRVQIGINPGATFSNAKCHIAFVSGSAITSWSPYSNICPISGWTGANVFHSGEDTSDYDTLSISWQSEAGTVYGGTLDVTTGVLTVTPAEVDLGTLSWTAYRTFWYASLPDIKDCLNGNVKPNIVCSSYPTITYNQAYNGGVIGVSDYMYQHRIVVIDPALEGKTSAQVAEAMSGVKAVYELATPLTYQLDPVTIQTLLGQNNIWADCGDSTVDYPADTKLYIQKMLS